MLQFLEFTTRILLESKLPSVTVTHDPLAAARDASIIDWRGGVELHARRLLFCRKILRLVQNSLFILPILCPWRPVLFCFQEIRRYCAIAVPMSDAPHPQGTNIEDASANTENGADQSWITHPAAAIVKATIGHRVLIVLNDLRELKGTCTCFDWLGNFVLSDWTQNIPAPPSGSF